MVGPIIAGPMAASVGWRNFWWLNVAMLAFNIVTLVVLFPETKWHRMHPNEVAPGGNVTPDGHGQGVQSDVSSTDKTHGGHSGVNDVDEIETKGPMPDLGLGHTDTAVADPYLGHGGPSRAQFRLWQPADQHTSWWTEIWTPWKLFAFPIVEFASFVVSWSASCFLTVNLTQAQNFAAPPYNYSSTVIGKLPFPYPLLSPSLPFTLFPLPLLFSNPHFSPQDTSALGTLLT
jgi:hypothetical protein